MASETQPSSEPEFKPYIPAEKVTPELTITSIVVGVLLAVVFGAANAYLGLRVGMTVSASIPAAVISMGVIRLLLRRNNILENNISQTIGSAGESLAAGAIFTLPALFIWASEGRCDTPGILEITVIAICGGVLGVLFMIPLRNALIVKEHATLPYPEGAACADVLMAGEKGGSQASAVVAGIGISAVLKFIVDGLHLVASDVTVTLSNFKAEYSMGAYPALLGVGYIVGHKVSLVLFAGSIVSWLVLIPLICFFGGNQVVAPGTDPISQLYLDGGATAIWSNYVRYIGAGAIVTGGIISLIKTLPVIVNTFKDSIANFKTGGGKGTARTSQDFSIKFVLIGSLAVILVLWLIPFSPVGLVGAILIAVFGFFFATVSSRMVGLVGASNNPVSGMAIATLLISTVLLKLTGNEGMSGMQTAIIIASVVSIVAAMAGDTSQDLKTGYLLGATPKKQQIGLFIGSLATALALGGILYLLNSAWSFGSEAVPAPQATLMKTIVEGVMDGNLPWNLVFIGVFLAIALEIAHVPVMSFAIGVYLPVSTTATIMLGGAIRWIVDRKRKGSETLREEQSRKGTLFSAGLIAGEGLMGIVLAVFAIANASGVIDMSGVLDIGNVGPLIVIAIMVLCLLKFTIWSKPDAGDGGEDEEKAAASAE